MRLIILRVCAQSELLKAAARSDRDELIPGFFRGVKAPFPA